MLNIKMQKLLLITKDEEDKINSVIFWMEIVIILREERYNL